MTTKTEWKHAKPDWYLADSSLDKAHEMFKIWSDGYPLIPHAEVFDGRSYYFYSAHIIKSNEIVKATPSKQVWTIFDKDEDGMMWMSNGYHNPLGGGHIAGYFISTQDCMLTWDSAQIPLDYTSECLTCQGEDLTCPDCNGTNKVKTQFFDF